MSDLSKPKECAEWISDWHAHYMNRATPRPDLLHAKLAAVAAAQRANYRAAAQRGGFPSIDQYRRAVEMLERAALKSSRDKKRLVEARP